MTGRPTLGLGRRQVKLAERIGRCCYHQEYCRKRMLNISLVLFGILPNTSSFLTTNAGLSCFNERPQLPAVWKSSRGLHQQSGSSYDVEYPTWNAIAEELEQTENVFSLLARKGKTWIRLRHFIELSSNNQYEEHKHVNEPKQGIADIGCDHGILSLALAFSGRYSSVVGGDASEVALRNGALYNQQKILQCLGLEYDRDSSQKRFQINGCTVDFRVGDGLTVLKPKEVNCICLAGMGVDTMMQVLFSRGSSATTSELERVDCQYVYLQPTNPRPRYLVRLYDALQMAGYAIYQERIAYLSNRWYITVAFVKRNGDVTDQQEFALPGSYLSSLSKNDPMHRVYMDYVDHHLRWITADARNINSALRDEDRRWLEQNSLKQ